MIRIAVNADEKRAQHYIDRLRARISGDAPDDVGEPLVKTFTLGDLTSILREQQSGR